jgi:hypothetical protein
VFGPEVTEWSELFRRDWTHRPELGYCERSTTLAEAKVEHMRAINWVKEQSWYVNDREPPKQ